MALGQHSFGDLAPFIIGTNPVGRCGQFVASAVVVGKFVKRLGTTCLGVACPSAVVLHHHPWPVQMPDVCLRRGFQEFVQDTGPLPIKPRGHQSTAAVERGAIFGVKVVGVVGKRWPDKTIRCSQGLIGIDEEQVVAVILCKIQCFGAVVAEVHPGPSAQLARDASQSGFNAHRCMVHRAGIDDDSVVYEGANGDEAALDDGGLVTNDHVEADGD
jgi:hypothetical protein